MTEAKSIKEELIQALNNLSGLKNDKKFAQLIKQLEDPITIIPNDKPTLDLLKFTYLLVCQYPQILADPKSQPLYNICKEIVKKLLSQDFPEESMKTQPSSRKK